MTAAIALPIQKSIINPLLKGYGFPVACILGSLVLLLLSIRPAYTKIQDLRVRRAQTERVLALLSNKVAKLEEFASREEALTQDFERFNRAVTSESNIPELLTQIQTIATETGVKITVLQFGGELRPSPGVGSGVVSGFEARIKFASQGSF
ncbi:type 4a pilus biogenesis protein PilO, partial [Candidatus Saccharibacteria bacterium]|nr:type 4a pilus biogenesis protein PilO [Candidatus Saccharibacteria bacterium]